MSKVTHYTNCPVCSSANLSPVFNVKDHTVSQEYFSIIECKDCSIRFTQDVPDAASIGPYYKSEDYISHSNTSKGFINRLYQFVRKRTLRNKRKLLQKVTGLPAGSLLDVGSGIGAFVQEMKIHGWLVTGLEPDADARKVAQQTYALGLMEPDHLFELPPAGFDAITLWHVLEHVHELHNYMARLKILMKENGRLFIAVPNYSSVDAAIYNKHWAAYDVPRHLYHFSPRSMKTLVEKHGMVIEQYKPMWYDSFYISLLSSKYKNGKSNLITSCWNGFRSNLAALQDVKRCSSVIYIIRK